MAEELNAEGLRVLGVAVRELPSAAAALRAAGGGADSPAAPGTPQASASMGRSAGALEEAQDASPRAPRSPAGGRLAASEYGSASSLASCAHSYSTEHEADMTFVGFLAFLVRLGLRTAGCRCMPWQG